MSQKISPPERGIPPLSCLPRAAVSHSLLLRSKSRKKMPATFREITHAAHTHLIRL